VKQKRGTGPRTPTGKERSKHNATTHGLFSHVTVLPHESQSEFDNLVEGLRGVLKPEGALEDAMIGIIAAILWRKRRHLQAERAIVQSDVEAQKDEDAGFSHSHDFWAARAEEIMAADRRGALRGIDDPNTLEACFNKLLDVLEFAEASGFLHRLIPVKLGWVFGARYPGRPGHDLFDYYRDCVHAYKSTEAERKARGFESQVDCERKFMAAVAKEISRLERRRKGEPSEPVVPTRADAPMSMKAIQLVVPDSGEMDRLLRYETHLDRALDRAFSQLERAQELRQRPRTIVLPGHSTI
jgi:hypothetical protein